MFRISDPKKKKKSRYQKQNQNNEYCLQFTNTT